MARVSRWAIFIRAFLIALLAGTPARVGSATTEDEAAWTEAVQTGTVSAFYAYLSRFPAGAYVDRAIASLVQLGAITPSVRELPPQVRPEAQRPTQVTPPVTVTPPAPTSPRLYP